uniref:Uncharacterized protein n=1 Tax=Lygus hesperus TaxID=30085 RepID=A0A0K8SDA2_LYGHE
MGDYTDPDWYYPFLPFSSIKPDLINLMHVLCDDDSQLGIEGVLTATFLLVIVFSFVASHMKHVDVSTPESLRNEEAEQILIAAEREGPALKQPPSSKPGPPRDK